MKKNVCRETLLVYLNFSKPFVIHTDASKVVISQDNKPIAFYIESKSCTGQLHNHRKKTVISIIETL